MPDTAKALPGEPWPSERFVVCADDYGAEAETLGNAGRGCEEGSRVGVQGDWMRKWMAPDFPLQLSGAPPNVGGR
jgi:hypothetical protein